ncbi:MAG: DNA cytosine methyltransferase [Oscillospiraceae bacterium]
MKILVACEESQAITIELRKLRHEAYSCDTETCSGNHPEWHLQQDVTPLLKMRWDMIIAHPPCTYMSNAGACRMYPTKGHIDTQRLKKAMKAKEFFMQFYNANCDKIAIENPMPLKVVGLPQETQRIQPYQFGEPWSKKTYLWLKGLPLLEPTDIVDNYKPFVPSGTGRKMGGASYGAKNVAHNSRDRSKTFHGIAVAMALQWAGIACVRH